MNCRDFLNEFEDRNALTDAAARHLKDCADCRKIDAAQTRVWKIIDGFVPVDAPNDFDFRVKARIANAKASDFQTPVLPVLRYVVPFGAFVVILAFVVFNGIYSLDDTSVPAIAEKSFQAPIQKENLPAETFPSQQIAGINDLKGVAERKSVVKDTNGKPLQIENKKESKTFENKNQFVAVKSVKKPQTELVKDEGKISGGSQVQAVKPPEILLPRGIPNSNQKVENPTDFLRANSITVEQILTAFGIEISAKNGNRQVKTVKPNSVGERSGVKVGDVIEAIDGRKLSSEPISGQTIEVKKLTVLRSAEKIEIVLHN